MKTIILKQNGMGRYVDVSPFPMGDLELELQGIPTYSGEFRFLAYCNNVKCSENTVTATNNRVSIPRLTRASACLSSDFVRRIHNA